MSFNRKHIQYPYNLLSDIIGEPWVKELTDDQEAGLQRGLEELSLRERSYIFNYYEGRNTLRKIAGDEGISATRVGQIIRKGVNRLKTQSAINKIKLGLRTYEEEKRESELLVSDINLSVRTYNCLRRSNINTFNDLEALVTAKGYGGLFMIRNMGRKSTEEVLIKMSEITGKDYIKIANEKC